MLEVELVGLEESAVYQNKTYTHYLVFEHRGDEIVTGEESGFSDEDIGNRYGIQVLGFGKVIEKVSRGKDEIKNYGVKSVTELIGELVECRESDIVLSFRGEKIDINVSGDPLPDSFEEGDLVRVQATLYLDKLAELE